MLPNRWISEKSNLSGSFFIVHKKLIKENREHNFWEKWNEFHELYFKNIKKCS